MDEDGNPVPATVTVTHTASGIQRSFEVYILEPIPVDHITLQAASDRVTAGSSDSLWVGATCFLSNEGFAPDCTIVFFESDMGHFLYDSVHVTGNFGQAENWFIPDPRTGMACMRSYVINADSSVVYSNEVEVEIVAGPPARGVVTIDPPFIETGGHSTITVTVFDAYDNPVRGTLVSITTTVGSINPAVVATDENGKAIAHFFAGGSAGVAIITITFNTPDGPFMWQTTLLIRTANPNNIVLTADPEEIEAGSGSTITAMIYDAYGNLVIIPLVVVFQLLNEPDPPVGCDINDHGSIDSCIVSGGIGQAGLHAGTLTGPKLLRAYTLIENPDDPDIPDTISAINSRIRVIGGPPDQIDIDVNNRGEDGGAGVWIIEVSARVYDRYMNPAGDGIPVWFTCDSVATIGDAVTGNENRNGDSTPGVAYAIMQYNSDNTFDTLTINGQVRVADRMIEATREYQLPLQQGYLTLNVSPNSWMIDAPDMETACFTCVATLLDGHEVTINNAPVLFNSNRAYFYWYNYYEAPCWRIYDHHANPPILPIKYTGWNVGNGHREHRENRGEATVYLRGEEEDFFLDDVSPEMNVQIGAQVLGYEDVIADPVIVVVTRNP